MTNSILPKSLHTVTVLANVAYMIVREAEVNGQPERTARGAIKAALAVLDYAGSPDPYGLADKALAVLQKRLAVQE